MSFWSSLGSLCPSLILLSNIWCKWKLKSMKMIPLGKSLEMSISLHFAYINSYMHTFIYSVSIFIQYFKNEQIHWKFSQVVQSYKFFLIINRTIQLPLVNPDPREHLPTVRILRTEKEVNCQSSMEHQQAARVKEMGDEQRNFLQMMNFSYPTILLQTQMPQGQSSGQGQDLEGPSMDPFRVPNLDNPYE